MAGGTPKRRGRPPKKATEDHEQQERQQQQQDTAEPSKRRGRPPKPKQGDDGDIVQQNNETPKRGRGRPPKPKEDNNGTQTSSATPKRGRGRPPKPKQDGNNVQMNSVTPKRGRGRPPKSQQEQAAAASKSISNKTTSTKGPAKPRGRPRKSETVPTKDTTRTASIAGGYAITCKDISEQWDSHGDDFGIDISESSTPGVFVGSFDFGILEGAMVLSSDETLLNSFVDKLESETEPESSEDDRDSEDEDDATVYGGRKRKATGTTRGQPVKKVKKVPSPGLQFHILWRGRDTSEGQIHHDPSPGTIKFTNKNYTKFRGVVDLPAVGADVEIVGEKVTDQTSAGDINSWNDYTEEEYERANVRRWL